MMTEPATRGRAVKRTALFCVLDSLTGAYSLTQVLIEQAKMLALAGYPVQIWLLADWTLAADPAAQALLAEHPRIEFVPCLPRLRLYDYHDFHRPVDDCADADDPCPRFAEKTARLVAALSTHVASVDCVLCHDLTFQTWYLPHGAAVRTLAARHPRVRWFHWQHSGPAPVPEPLPAPPHRGRFTPMEQSRFVYVNEDADERGKVAAARGIPPGHLAFVPNSRDLLEYFALPARLKQYAREHDLLSAELLLVLPGRLDEGKQPKKALLFTQALCECGVDARLVWCAAYAPLTEPKHGRYMNELFQFAGELGMPAGSYQFTSFIPEWRDGCPREVVRGFQQMADVFLLPSLSEAHSLVASEAALCRNVLVLNDDFPAMRSWFPQGAAEGVRFSSRLQTSEHTFTPEAGPPVSGLAAEQVYYREQAYRLLARLQDAPGWRAFSFMKRERNLEIVFRRYLERLLWSI